MFFSFECCECEDEKIFLTAEIEVHLAYLQPSKDLGVNLQAMDMLYRACSNVSDEELRTVKTGIETIGMERLATSHLYHDEGLRLAPFVQEIIKENEVRPEFSTEPLDGEIDEAFRIRMQNLPQIFSETVIAGIQEKIKEAIKDATKEKTACEEMGREDSDAAPTVTSSVAKVDQKTEPALNVTVDSPQVGREGLVKSLRGKVQAARAPAKEREMSFEELMESEKNKIAESGLVTMDHRYVGDGNILTREVASRRTPSKGDVGRVVGRPHGDALDAGGKKKSGDAKHWTK